MSVAIFVTIAVRISNSKFGCCLFFSCNFPNKIFANGLLFVKAKYFARTRIPTSRFLSNYHPNELIFQEMLLGQMFLSLKLLKKP